MFVITICKFLVKLFQTQIPLVPGLCRNHENRYSFRCLPIAKTVHVKPRTYLGVTCRGLSPAVSHV